MVLFLQILLLAALGGSGAVLIKMGVLALPPFYFNTLRFALSSMILVPLALKSKPVLRQADVRVRWFWIWIAAGCNLGNVALFAIGIPETNAALSQSLYVLAPLLVYLVGTTLKVERRDPRKLLGVLLGVGGAAATVLHYRSDAGGADGVLYIAGAVLSYTAYLLVSKRLHQRWSSTQLAAAMTVLVAVASLMLSIALGENWSSLLELSSAAVIGILGAALFGTVAYHVLAQHLINKGSPVIGSYALLLQPFSALLLGSALLNERISGAAFLYAAITVGGAYLVLRRKSAAP